jgi:hypothetical protein
MPVYFDDVTGTPSQVRSLLLRKLSAHTRRDRVRGFKIGVTNDPAGRFSKAYSRDFHEMIVLYQTTSIDFVSELEADLFEHNWEVADNLVAGGGGRIGDPPYFLYVALRR